MENNFNAVKRESFFEKTAKLLFTIYLITLYTVVDRRETFLISHAAFFLFAGVAILHLLQVKRFHLGKNVMLVYICFSWMFASITWAENSYLAYVKMRTMWQIFILFFLVYNLFYEDENAHERFLKSLYIAGIALIGYSIYIYGFSEVIEMMTGSSNVRLGRDINQENTFGMMNATTCMIAFYYLFYKKRFKIFHISVLSIAFLFAMSSGSRKALLITCIGILFLVYQRYGLRQVYKVVAIVVVLALIFLAVIKLPVFETIRFRMEQGIKSISGERGGDHSTQLRMNMVKDGWKVFKERIPIGYGADNYRYVSSFGTYSHNNFIEILVDFGLIGFMLYYLIYLNVLKNLVGLKKNSSKALLCIFLVRFMMEIAMVPYYDKTHWIMMALFLIDDENLKYRLGGEKNGTG